MLIAISALTFIATDHVMFDAAEDSDLENTARRVSRTATLDGGCLIVDDGYSDSDATINIDSKEPLSGNDIAILRTLHQDHALIAVTTPAGVCKGVIQRFRNTNNKASLTILAKEKLSA